MFLVRISLVGDVDDRMERGIAGGRVESGLKGDRMGIEESRCLRRPKGEEPERDMTLLGEGRRRTLVSC